MIILYKESNSCTCHILCKERRLRVHLLIMQNRIRFQYIKKVSEGYMRLLHSSLFCLRMTRMHYISRRMEQLLGWDNPKGNYNSNTTRQFLYLSRHIDTTHRNYIPINGFFKITSYPIPCLRSLGLLLYCLVLVQTYLFLLETIFLSTS